MKFWVPFGFLLFHDSEDKSLPHSYDFISRRGETYYQTEWFADLYNTKDKCPCAVAAARAINDAVVRSADMFIDKSCLLDRFSATGSQHFDAKNESEFSSCIGRIVEYARHKRFPVLYLEQGDVLSTICGADDLKRLALTC